MTVETDNTADTSGNTETQSAEQLAAERAALLKKNQELLDEKKTLAASLKAFEGIDASTARQLLTEKEANDKKMAMARGEFEKLEASLKEAHSTREQSLVGRLDKALRSEAAVQAIAEAGGNPTLLLPHVLNRSKMVEQDGDFVVQVLDKHGLPMEGKTFTDLMAELQADTNYAGAFKSTSATGTGATTVQNANQPIPNPYLQENWNVGAQGRLQRSNPALNAEYKKQAGY